MTDPSLPPVMQTPGLRLVAIGQTDDGRSYMKFTTNRRRMPDVVIIIANDPTKFVYVYSLFDDNTSTIQHYAGVYGDPTKDQPDNEGPWGVPI
jgi:hypothetical protein